MAKQIGVFRVRGKMGEHSFYHSRSGGDLIRSINQEFSNRVKTEDAFVNTRKNAVEFQKAAKMASGLVDAYAYRWRYILKPDSVAVLTKCILEQIRKDTTHVWGARELLIQYSNDVCRQYNLLSKNPMPAFVQQWANQITAAVTLPDQMSVNTIFTIPTRLTLPMSWMQEMEQMGLDGVQVLVLASTITNEGRYINPIIAQGDTLFDAAEDIDIIQAQTPSFRNVFVNPTQPLSTTCVVMLPYYVKRVGSTPYKYISQKACAAYTNKLEETG